MSNVNENQQNTGVQKEIMPDLTPHNEDAASYPAPASDIVDEMPLKKILQFTDVICEIVNGIEIPGVVPKLEVNNGMLRLTWRITIGKRC
jgi:hypothetical protein